MSMSMDPAHGMRKSTCARKTGRVSTRWPQNTTTLKEMTKECL